jgi:SAM-dependent methyltransferase
MLVRDAKRFVKGALRRVGVDVRLAGHDWTDIEAFIPFEATLKAAAAARMSVGEYIDGVMNGIPGATQSTIQQMRALGVFVGPIRVVLEIGPGSGRYLEKTLLECSPERYEIYETAGPWVNYLERTYSVVVRPTDGVTLAATPDDSVDLVQAHKVFSGADLLVTLRYWREMARVAAPGGFVVFDIVTEGCLSPETVDRWAASELKTGSYPAAVPRQGACDFFSSRGFRLAGSFTVPMGPGTTEVLAFQKRARNESLCQAGSTIGVDRE